MKNIVRIPRKYTPVKQWSDEELGNRLGHLHRNLSTLADRHSAFVEGLIPIAPEKWTEVEMGEV